MEENEANKRKSRSRGFGRWKLSLLPNSHLPSSTTPSLGTSLLRKSSQRHLGRYLDGLETANPPLALEQLQESRIQITNAGSGPVIAEHDRCRLPRLRHCLKKQQGLWSVTMSLLKFDVHQIFQDGPSQDQPPFCAFSYS